MNKSSIVSQIKSAAITLCIEQGIDDSTIVKDLLLAARDGVGPMSVAGVKAAITKEQNVSTVHRLKGKNGAY